MPPAPKLTTLIPGSILKIETENYDPDTGEPPQKEEKFVTEAKKQKTFDDQMRDMQALLNDLGAVCALNLPVSTNPGLARTIGTLTPQLTP